MGLDDILRLRGDKALRIAEKNTDAYSRQSRAQLISSRQSRNNWLLPMIGVVLLFVFLIGPSLTVILQIISTVSPLVWVTVLFIILYLWRKHV